MPTYMVTNRTAKDAVALRPLTDPIAVLRAPNPNESDYSKFVALKSPALRNLKNSMPQEAIELAAGQHYPLIVVFIHGYNNNTDAGLNAMATIGNKLPYNVLGAGGTRTAVSVNPLMVCLDWPSNHQVWSYLSDEGDAMQSVPAVMQLLEFLQNWRDPATCKVNVCVIAHSMGNFVMMQGMLAFWKKMGQPARLPNVSEVLMVAADVDSNVLEVGAKEAASRLFQYA